MNKELKAHHDAGIKMLGDDFKPFSGRASTKEWKGLKFGSFNTIKNVLSDDNMPEVPRRAETAVRSKYRRPRPKGAFEHDKGFFPSAGSKCGKTM